MSDTQHPDANDPRGESDQTPVYPPRPPLPPTAASTAHETAPTGSSPTPQMPSQQVPPQQVPQAQATQPTQPYTSATFASASGTTRTANTAKVGGAKVAGLIVAAALVGGASGVGGAYLGSQLWAPSTTVVAGEAGGAVTVNNTDDVTATTGIAAKVVPSVVTIEASDANAGAGGSGSGVVLSEDGYVVTNTHVVTLGGASGSAEVRATASDGRIYGAEIIGTDPVYDLAVIKLEDASGLTPIDFADSSQLNVGDQSVAVGAPLGLSNTVTTGIVSALNRSIEISSAAAPDSGEEQGEEDGNSQGPFQFDIPGQESAPQSAESIKISAIQTDAAVNPGNSGGALVDGDGNLIGINVAIASAGSSDGSGSIGVGFAIPSNIVERVTAEIIETGVATHGLLGATVVPASMIEDASIAGAYIDSVTPGGGAESAGLREGDVVTAFDGLPVTDAVDLTALVRAAAGGSDVTVTFVRDGETQQVEATLGSLGE
ncbi:trypsin-like peptidase domain-containing protein [Microbacterium sp. LRZ72]|uniref:S1C family serine protease n=1 Tax=Microbacterium sp. LRZ72 TaxID=2942481 RepID=UPI0029AB2FBB|nr:trypsin-like peptidase domain-containing protein [Microbacterium sp. LRZ72]MDX2377932.1 trypsin-like peptidase domain-containing protein [Microbacterium sp. LRZ72]